MTSKTRTMAACLADAQASLVENLLQWQRAVTCYQQRDAMQIVDDDRLTELGTLEIEMRAIARRSFQEIGVNPDILGGLSNALG